MAKGFIGASGCKAYLGGIKFKKGYIGSTKVYSAGNIVTYCVDSGTTYTEEVDEGASCLSPKSFTPAKSGWEFAGWRQDKTASGNVLSNLIMGDAPVTLYAVFRQSVQVTLYNGSTTADKFSGYRHYNTGNVVNPSFTLVQNAISGWTARGWSGSSHAAGDIVYSNGGTYSFASNATLFGMYYQTITVTYYNASTSASSTSGTRYYNSNGNTVNPSFTLTQVAISGWTARGWSTGTAGNAGITYNNGAAFARESNVTLYGMYQQNVTLTTVANGTSSPSTKVRYYNSGANVTVNPTFTVANPSKSSWTFQGWSAAAGSTSVTNSAISNLSLSASTTRYAVWSRVVPASQKDTGYIYNGLIKSLSYTPGGAWTATGVVSGVNSIANNTTAGVYVEAKLSGTVVRRWYNDINSMSNGAVKENSGYPGTGGVTFTVSGTGALTGSIATTSWRFYGLTHDESSTQMDDVGIRITKVTVTVPAYTEYSVG